VEWTGPEDSEEPAPVVLVAAASSVEEVEHGADAKTMEESRDETADDLPDSGGIDPAFYYLGLGCVALALLAATLAALRRGQA